MASSGQSNRRQFQIGNTCVSPAGVGRAGIHPRRKRRHDAHTACASSLAQGLCLLGTGGANAQQAGLPVPPKLASKHSPLAGPEPAERATNHSPLATAFSNRYTARVECPLTHSKQMSLVLSNRYKFVPPVGATSWLPTRPTLRISNRYIPRIEIAVTPSKQTTVALSTRYKRPPPGGYYFATPAPLSGTHGLGGGERRNFRPTHPGF
jgi:hypothetical protein